MREYELTYLVSDNVPESDLNKVTGKVGGYVVECDGKVKKEEIWGRRKLAYPIQKQEFATYVTVNFELPANRAAEFERNIILTGKIVRHLMIVKDFGTEELTLTHEDIVKTEEIEEVVGGEKSFEAIVGETEESKDLMAKREKGETGVDHPTSLKLRGAGELNEPRTEKIKEEEKTPEAPIVAEEETTPEISEIPEEKAEEELAGKVEKEQEIKEVKEDAASVEDGAGTPASAASGMRGKEAPVKKIEQTKPVAAKSVKKFAKKEIIEENEADRLSKLDKELDDILGEDL